MYVNVGVVTVGAHTSLASAKKLVCASQPDAIHRFDAYICWETFESVNIFK